MECHYLLEDYDKLSGLIEQVPDNSVLLEVGCRVGISSVEWSDELGRVISEVGWVDSWGGLNGSRYGWLVETDNSLNLQITVQ